jgi:hypothetical protein
VNLPANEDNFGVNSHTVTVNYNNLVTNLCCDFEGEFESDFDNLPLFIRL